MYFAPIHARSVWVGFGRGGGGGPDLVNRIGFVSFRRFATIFRQRDNSNSGGRGDGRRRRYECMSRRDLRMDLRYAFIDTILLSRDSWRAFINVGELYNGAVHSGMYRLTSPPDGIYSRRLNYLKSSFVARRMDGHELATTYPVLLRTQPCRVQSPTKARGLVFLSSFLVQF